MAGESFPDELREWVERAAAERDADPDEILARAVATYRALEEGVDDDVAGLDELDDRVSALEGDLDAKIQDVRERVVQVKRETDARAPADHDHPDLTARIEGVERTVADVDRTVADLERRLDRGFENYEEILEYLTDATDALEDRTASASEAVSDLRSDLDRIVAAEHDRRAVDDLRTEANRHGERTAACADCDATVDLGLLARPRCPHCEATFVAFEPSTGFFGSATLATGDRPALAAGGEAADVGADGGVEGRRPLATDRRGGTDG